MTSAHVQNSTIGSSLMMLDTNLLRREAVGHLIRATGAVDDVVGWALLPIVSALAANRAADTVGARTSDG